MFHKVVLYIYTNYREIIAKIYKTTLVMHKTPIIGKAEHRYTKQPLWNIKYQWWGNHNTDMFHKRCFVYLCYDFLIIDILCFTSVVLYICVMNFLQFVFYVSQALFCISVLWFPYNLYFMSHIFCFVYSNYRKSRTQIHKTTFVKHKISMMGKS
jgi:hypothetical protein